MFTTAHADSTPPGNPIIVIENNTGSQVTEVRIKPAGTDDWGPNLENYLPNGRSKTITLNQPLSVQNEYDIAVKQMFNWFYKRNVTVTEGMVVTFTSADQ